MKQQGRHLRVGITGGIGSGKSVVMRIFDCLGVRIYSADQRAKWLMEHSEVIVRQVKDVFGSEAYNAEGHLERAYLASRIYADKSLNERLNAIVHPAVEQDFEAWAEEDTTSPYVVKEAALLFEAGTYKKVDVVVNIAADPAIRLQRTLARDPHRDASQVEAIISRQLSEEERQSRAQYTIVNDDTHSVIAQCVELHKLFLKEQGRKATV